MSDSHQRYSLPTGYFPGFQVQVACGGYDKNLSYLITEPGSGNQWLVDPALNPEAFFPPPTGQLKGILITHTHGDHIRYLDSYLALAPELILYGYDPDLPHPHIVSVRDGDTIPVGSEVLRVITTPGHYPDSLCFLFRQTVFTGDTLFVGRTGRTIDSRSNTADLYRSVYLKLLTLPPDTLILPGHDYGPKPWVTLEENVACSPLLRARNERDFINRMARYEASRT